MFTLLRTLWVAASIAAADDPIDFIRDDVALRLDRADLNTARELDVLRIRYPHAPEFWAGAIAALALEPRSFAEGSLELALFDALPTHVGTLLIHREWSAHRAPLRKALVDLYAQTHESSRRLCVVHLMSSLHLWTRANLRLLSEVYIPTGDGRLGHTWLEFVRHNAFGTKTILTEALRSPVPENDLPLLILAAAYQAGVITSREDLVRFFKSFADEFRPMNFRSVRAVSQDALEHSLRTGMFFERESLRLVNSTFSNLRERLNERDVEVKAAFTAAERFNSRSLNLTPDTHASREFKNLVEWMKSTEPPNNFFRRALLLPLTSPCNDTLGGRSTPLSPPADPPGSQ